MEKQSSELKSRCSLLADKRETMETVEVMVIAEEVTEIEDVVVFKVEETTIDPADQELASTVAKKTIWSENVPNVNIDWISQKTKIV